MSGSRHCAQSQQDAKQRIPICERVIGGPGGSACSDFYTSMDARCTQGHCMRKSCSTAQCILADVDRSCFVNALFREVLNSKPVSTTASRVRKPVTYMRLAVPSIQPPFVNDHLQYS